MPSRREKQSKQRKGTRQFSSGCGARKSKRQGVLQYGGVSPACVLNGATGTDVLYRDPNVNLHNTNPQASLDLDNKFMNYGGAVPLGNNILQGGSAKCGDEGLGGSGNGKSETFKQYLDGLTNQYTVGGASSTQNGGGFTTDPSEYIAGLPVYRAYDDCCPPAIVNNKLVMGAPGQPVCGLGAVRGGARRHRSSSRKHKRSSKNNKKNKKTSNRHHKSRRSNRHQRGGADFVYSSLRSKPAPMADAFNGPAGVFRYPDDMMTRNFGEVQPNYSVNAI